MNIQIVLTKCNTKNYGYGKQSNGGKMNLRRFCKKRTRSDFNPDSVYIEKETKAFLSRGGKITRLKRTDTASEFTVGYNADNYLRENYDC